MFDQSFSPKNLAKIYHQENKKGINIAGRFFPEVLEEYGKIKRVRSLIQKLFINKEIYKKNSFEERLTKLYELKKIYNISKNTVVEAHLDSISQRINSKIIPFTICKLPYLKNNKDVYVTENNPESFFLEKQIQKNIKYTYSVKQADRDLIVPQLRAVLDDRFPKYIIKTDIKSFYERIDRRLLLNKLNKNPILSLSTRKIIAKVLREYGDITATEKGIPRGIGMSAYLAELYLKNFDQQICKINNLIYYARYVDDIVLVVSPKPSDKIEKYFQRINSILSEDNLELNKSANKTKLIDFPGPEKSYSFDYLGYGFKYISKSFYLTISEIKKIKYKNRISKTIESYQKKSVKQPRKARRELLMRLRFLTTNTNLFNNKNYAVVGIYNSNKWATNFKFLSDLDDYLQKESIIITNNHVTQRISKFSFLDGFINRGFTSFSDKDFRVIVKVWK